VSSAASQWIDQLPALAAFFLLIAVPNCHVCELSELGDQREYLAELNFVL
jgi:hypothetical protein